MSSNLVIMGVAGCGKSTVAAALVAVTGARLIEGDDHHSAQSRLKMQQGIALDDADRSGWLDTLANLLAEQPQNQVLTCSALKRAYRMRLRAQCPNLRFAFLDLSRAEAGRRVSTRPGHFFSSTLVDSQFATLERPDGEPGVRVLDATRPLAELTQQLLDWTTTNGPEPSTRSPHPMKLFFSPNSPFVRKCLIVAREHGLDERITLLPSQAHPLQRDASIMAFNPLAQVPTLITGEGQVLHDSRVICEYLDALGGGGLFPAQGRARWQALTLQSLADGLLNAALLARYEEAVRPEPLRYPAWQAAQIDKIDTTLTALEAVAVAGDSATVGPLAGRVDIGTIALACALWYLDLRFAGHAWRSRYPALKEWDAALRARPSIAASWSLAG